MNNISKKILDYAKLNGCIRDDCYDEYLYMLTMILNILITDVPMLAIGIVMKMVWECIMFWIIYKILRKYCGGFHFSTSLRCYLSSCVMCPAVLCSIRFIPYNMIFFSVLAAASAVILLILSPIAALTKPLDPAEISVFGKIARIITIIALLLYIAFVFLQLYTAAKIIVLDLMCVAVFAVWGKLQLKFRKQA